MNKSNPIIKLNYSNKNYFPFTRKQTFTTTYSKKFKKINE